MHPKISVIIPVYNVEKYLRRCLNSVLSQSFDNWEAICINDGSTDNSLVILDKYASKDSRIKVISQKNMGLSMARNNGLAQACGKYICFLDSDDFIDKNFLLNLYKEITQTKADVAMAPTRYLNDKKTKTDVFEHKILTTFQEKVSSLPHGGCWNKLYSRQFLLEHNIQFPKDLYWEDNIFTIKACYFSNQIAVIDEGCYNYVHNDNSITSNPAKEEKRKADSLIIAQQIIDFITQQKCRLQERNVVVNFCLRSFINDKHLLDQAFYQNITNILGRNTPLQKLRKKQFRKKLQKKIAQILLKKKVSDTKSKFYIFGLPLFQIKHKNNYSKYYLFNIPIYKRKSSQKIFLNVSSENFHPFPINDSLLLKKLHDLNKFTYIPNPGNMGDMLIAAATLQFFDRNKLPYTMFQKSSKPETIVYGGGGIWTNDYKEAWINILPYFQTAQKILILPGSFYNCSKLVEQLDERFIVFCREQQSYEYLTNANTKAEILLDHDMAFRLDATIFQPRHFTLSRNTVQAIKKLDLTRPKLSSVGYFLRKDCESIYDYSTDLDLSALLYGNYHSTKDYIMFCALLMLCVVDSVNAVVTDRLHVGIASILMGKPTYLLDNSYKKVSNVYNHTLKSCQSVYLLNELPLSITASPTTSDNLAKLCEAIL